MHSGSKNANELLSPGEIYQIAYISTSMIPPLEAGGTELIKSILETSQHRNKMHGVTGALTFNEFYFAQVIEGTRRSVESIFSSILKDARHTQIDVIEEQWIPQRDFAQWAMAYVGDFDSIKVISPNPHLGDILAQAGGNGEALVQMMMFFLLDTRAKV